MGERSKYTPGSFCSVDLAAADPDQGMAFYAGLFGWDHAEPYRGWIGCLLDGKVVAGIISQPDDQREAGIPSNWLSYVSVTDVEADAGRAVDLGGTVLAQPTDVGEGGRLAVIADPQGAVVAMWQPIGYAGVQMVNVPGALTWNQLSTSHPEAAIAFYTELFRWSTEAPEGGNGSFVTFKNSEGWLNGGVMPLQPGTAGLSPILPVPAGELFIAQDDQGAVFGLFAGEFDP